MDKVYLLMPNHNRLNWAMRQLPTEKVKHAQRLVETTTGYEVQGEIATNPDWWRGLRDIKVYIHPTVHTLKLSSLDQRKRDETLEILTYSNATILGHKDWHRIMGALPF